ncbi:hypothetical protein QBC47DRAFT_392902 [Echria macrotheca]|uniref:Uncharacterized protein n=1 Tax=Echria macrotheca TaxID=438768 RepID=A0AAJ0B483_9PEZI|nr:hypothetical protein QBC47DRAFT_392902 [Echria macrotheca]
MNLSREAIILLRPPSSSSSEDSHPWTSPKTSFLSGEWALTHSTLPSRRFQSNTTTTIQISASGETTRTHTYSAITTSTDNDENQPKSTTTTEKATDFDPTTNTASVFETWKVLAWGKEGQLESWMIDDGDGWISDDSGERRGDWRNSYVVVWNEGPEEKGVDVWDRWGRTRPLSVGTIRKIREALRAAGVEGELVKVAGVHK